MCACDYAFMVDGVPFHCNGEHIGRRHQLPALVLTAGSLIEAYGPLDECVNCRG